MPPKKKTVVAENETPAVEAPVKAKRERKSSKHPIVAVVTQDSIQGVFATELKRPIIAHLPIRSSEVKFFDQPLQYDPNLPNPVAYEDSMTNPFANDVQEYLNEKGSVEPVVAEPVVAKATEPKVSQTKTAVAVATPPTEYGPATLLVQYASSKETQQIPMRTESACFWCCETFENRPCVIPSFIANGVWHVYGNFCTPHCASAYILAENLDTHVRWERLALLHRLYASYCGGRIYPAPDRETLERFGGVMTTSAFRQLCEQRKIRVDVHLPPMVSILASMDTKPIDFYETILRNTTTQTTAPIHTDTSLKLKRTKPLKDRESTLDACLNIQIKSK